MSAVTTGSVVELSARGLRVILMKDGVEIEGPTREGGWARIWVWEREAVEIAQTILRAYDVVLKPPPTAPAEEKKR